MTDKKPASGKASSSPSISRVRRISQPRPRKSPAQSDVSPPAEALETPEAPEMLAAAPPADNHAESAFTGGTDNLSATTHSATQEASSSPQPPSELPQADLPLAVSGEWPEPDAATSGGTPSHDGKRKRRRRKGKGQSAQANALSSAADPSPPHEDATDPLPVAAPKPTPFPSPAPAAPQQARQPISRTKLDPEALTSKAWKIFLAEVSEEGVALIGDQDARELARRCFRLAEIFFEEQGRRVPNAS